MNPVAVDAVQGTRSEASATAAVTDGPDFAMEGSKELL